MKKAFFFLLACAMSLLLTGCMQASVDCGVDARCNAYLKIHLQVDLSDAEPETAQAVRSSLKWLANDFHDTHGYTVESNFLEPNSSTPPDVVWLKMALTRGARSYEEAFEELKAMLTDESLTPFTRVSMAHAGGNFEQGYAFEAQMDANQLFGQTALQSLPQEIRDYIDNGAKQGSAALRVTLPASEVVENTGTAEIKNGFATAQTAVSFTDETHLKLVTRANMRNGRPLSVTAEKLVEYENTGSTVMEIVLWSAAAALVLTAIVSVIKFILSKNKNQVL